MSHSFNILALIFEISSKNSLHPKQELDHFFLKAREIVLKD